jgi:hypothetical protein
LRIAAASRFHDRRLEAKVSLEIVITGLDPVIHPLGKARYEDRWMPGSSPGMTSAFLWREASEDVAGS